MEISALCSRLALDSSRAAHVQWRIQKQLTSLRGGSWACVLWVTSLN
jgi:hypothetical protein